MRTSAHRVLGTKVFIVMLATRFYQKILRIFAQTRLFRDFLMPLRHMFFSRWSSGKVTGLSRRRPGFKSHSGHTFYLFCVDLFLVILWLGIHLVLVIADHTNMTGFAICLPQYLPYMKTQNYFQSM